MDSDNGSSTPLEDYPNRSIYTTWTLSYNQTKLKDEGATNLLDLWACLDNQDLWFELFTSALGLTWPFSPPRLQKTVSNKLNFRKGVQTLLAYSLIEAKQDSQAYSMHPVVHEWALEKLSSEMRDKLV